MLNEFVFFTCIVFWVGVGITLVVSLASSAAKKAKAVNDKAKEIMRVSGVGKQYNSEGHLEGYGADLDCIKELIEVLPLLKRSNSMFFNGLSREDLVKIFQTMPNDIWDKI